MNKISILIIFILVAPFFVTINGCGPSEEYKKVKEALELHSKVKERNAKIGKIRFLPHDENQKDKDLRFEADLLDDKGNIIGKAEGFRVEGFGTRIFRVRYNDEPEPPPRQRGQRPRRQRPPTPPPTTNEQSSVDHLSN
ncbi:MAG: hypothetical protein LDL53_09965 [Candidatus Hydrogenedens sp.]|nr:hypothetical protein [Candidatus Hydrogenedens sp.]